MRKTVLSPETIKKLDKSDMLGLLLDFPGQCRAAKDIAQNSKILFEKSDFDNIIFAGLGGSAIGADLVRSYLYFESRLPIAVYRDYELPASVSSSSLVFISSYSGDTEETLSAYRLAKEKGASIVAISCGGKLKEWALNDKITFIEIPRGIPPRLALGHMAIIPLCLLGRLGLAQDHTADVNQAIEVLEDLKRNSLHPKICRNDNPAKILAEKLFNKIAVVYSASVHFDVASIRLRCQLNENSKALASSYLFPEMNHNEISGWQNPAKLFKGLIVVMLRDNGVHERISLRMDITSKMLKKEGVEVIELWSRGEALLSRIFSLIYIGDLASFYLAILYGVDPTPVDKITDLKNELAKR